MDKFRICEDMDFEHQGSIVGLMKDVLTYLQKGKIPYEKYGEEDIKKYCESLVEMQRTEEPVAGSWSVSPEPMNTPEDEVVDFHYFPTYVAVAILSLVKQKFSSLADSVEGFDAALKKGLEYAVSNNLKGFGFDSYFQRLEAVILMSKGQVAELLLANPDLCPDLLKEFKIIKKEIAEAVAEKKIINEFGINMGNEFKAVLMGLQAVEI